MTDKFFDTVKDRFEFHADPIKRELRGLEGVASDYFGHLAPEFIESLNAVKHHLAAMERAIEELRSR
jgi:hypothetical protein